MCIRDSVAMALALKNLNLSHMVFVQYPSGSDPYNPNKVIPSAALAAQVVDRIKADEPIALDKSSLGSNAALESGSSKDDTATATTTKKHKKKADDTIAGLRGQTATQRTCSVAAAG